MPAPKCTFNVLPARCTLFLPRANTPRQAFPTLPLSLLPTYIPTAASAGIYVQTISLNSLSCSTPPRLRGNLRPRCFTTTSITRKKKKGFSSGVDDEVQGEIESIVGLKAIKSRLPRDQEITDRWIYVKQADGSLSAPVQTDRVLAALDLKTKMLLMVVPARRAPPAPEFPGPESSNQPPSSGPVHAICRIVDRKEYRLEQKALKKAKKEHKVQTKTLELNWAITEHDLGYKLKNVQKWLDSGAKVEIVFAPKKGGKVASDDDAEQTLERVKNFCQEAGGRAYKAAEGTLKKSYRFYYQGTKKQTKESATEEGLA